MALAKVLQRRLDRAKSEIAQLEGMIEDRTRSLFLAQENQRETAEFLGQVLASMTSAVLVLSSEGRVKAVNPAGCALLGRSQEELVGMFYRELIRFPDGAEDSNAPGVTVGYQEVTFLRGDASEVPVLFSGTSVTGADGVVCVGSDLSEKRHMEIELRHAQELESVGQLAAGVAHEVNTPIQFVGDSLHFLRDAFADLEGILAAYIELRRAVTARGEHTELCSKIAEEEDEADLAFLREEVPAAFARAADGVSRVSGIVGAMKEFAHPGSDQMEPVDINDAIETTLTVAKNEYKYFAEVDLQLGELPAVSCRAGDINQVILNLVINAAHAIEATENDERGRIGVRTAVDGDHAVIEVSDTGTGIPEDVRGRIFDPFFTTKKVGKGTGQGLSITHKIVVEKHGGEISFDTQLGVGTTFRVRLPFKEAVRGAA